MEQNPEQTVVKPEFSVDSQSEQQEQHESQEGESFDGNNKEGSQSQRPQRKITPAAQRQADTAIAEADEDLQMIEGILSEGMEDIYKNLSRQKQQEFKMKGEETARNIKTMVTGVKIHVKKIIEWIVDWLRIIPHVNKFFLKQEAKLKTDRIIKYIDERKSGDSKQIQN